jgi:hypothetical protein
VGCVLGGVGEVRCGLPAMQLLVCGCWLLQRAVCPWPWPSIRMLARPQRPPACCAPALTAPAPLVPPALPQLHSEWTGDCERSRVLLPPDVYLQAGLTLVIHTRDGQAPQLVRGSGQAALRARWQPLSAPAGRALRPALPSCRQAAAGLLPSCC